MKAEELMEFGKTIEQKMKEDPFKALLAASLCLMEASGKFAKVHNRVCTKGDKTIPVTDDYKAAYNELMEDSQIMALGLFFSGTNAADMFLKSQGYTWVDGGIIKTN